MGLAPTRMTSWLLLLLGLYCIYQLPSFSDAATRKEHVVYMGDRMKSEFPHKALHLTMMKQIIGSEATEHLLYSYENSFNGFVANLTDLEARKLAEMEGVVSVFPNGVKKIATTRSWDFMGLTLQVARNTLESDVIIGVIDTGIWPESPSFNDEGISPIPSRWKGICQNLTSNFTCNRKIIGGRFFRTSGVFGKTDIPSPRDTEGHGTHVASTIAGIPVKGANFFGLGNGTARGGVPSARIAVYKVCWELGCSDADILAAFDTAIADGVDMLSVSLGSSFAESYLRDSIAIGSFHAMRRGIFTSVAAGNAGPRFYTVSNVAPWFLSVAASTIDRKFTSEVLLGNGATFKGPSLNTFDLHNMSFPAIYGGTAQNYSSTSFSSSRYCLGDSLNGTMVKGKIVLCDTWSDGEGPLTAGAVGAIMNRNATLDRGRTPAISATYLGLEDGINIFSYIVTSPSPVASIFKSVEEKNTLAPFVVSFSARGPNWVSPTILKPDLTAPGADILAAWSPLSSPSGVEGDNRIVDYHIISGTSMACPHATAAAAYVKSFHPDWSPSAIKSALITTAFPLNASPTREAELAYGAGHINPLRAVDPGLVYDAEEADYVNFLCGEGFNSTHVRIISGDNSITCPQSTNGVFTFDLNYPSIALNISRNSTSFNRAFRRTVMNVGQPQSVYNASVKAPRGLNVEVVPSILSFTSVGEKATFEVILDGVLGRGDILSASLVWGDGVHQVKSPIVVYSESLS